jgi:hypothetical protein
MSEESDPIYEAWVEADRQVKIATKNYCDEIQRRLEVAKNQIMDEMKTTKFGKTLRITQITVKTAFDAYVAIHGKHPTITIKPEGEN